MARKYAQEEEQELVTEQSESYDDSVKRTIVVPGEILETGEDFLPGEGARRDGDKIVASKLGLAEKAGRVIKVISLTGAFVPRRNNIVIGRVTDVTYNGWLVDIDYPGSSFLPVAESPRFLNKGELDQFLSIGDMVAVKIWSVSKRGCDLSLKSKGLGKLEGGFVFHVGASKVPRIIGREGSMVNLVKEKTGCQVSVGQNGWVWIRGDNLDEEIRARKAVEFIASKVHVSGLTDKMEEWFNEN